MFKLSSVYPRGNLISVLHLGTGDIETHPHFWIDLLYVILYVYEGCHGIRCVILAIKSFFNSVYCVFCLISDQ